MKQRGWRLLASVLLLGSGLAPAAGAADPGWGLSLDNPAQVCRPAGQLAWLKQLRCADGRVVAWRHLGAAGLRTAVPKGTDAAPLFARYMAYQPLLAGEADHHLVDSYLGECTASVHRVYLDMFHCDAPAPQRAPRGLRWAGEARETSPR